MRWRILETHRRSPGRPPVSLIFWWTGIYWVVRLFFKFVYRVQLHGRENVPETGPVIYISNHQSHFDPCLVGLVVDDRPFRAMARESLFRFKILAWIMRGIGAIELEQGKGDTAAMKAALAELEAGRTVLIFPEGTRSPDGAIGQFHRGVTLLIRRSGAAVVPVALEGAFDAWPIGHDRPRLAGRGRMAVRAGPAIAASELLVNGPDAAIDRLRREVEFMRMELRRQLRQASGGRLPAAGPGDAPYWCATPPVKSV